MTSYPIRLTENSLLAIAKAHALGRVDAGIQALTTPEKDAYFAGVEKIAKAALDIVNASSSRVARAAAQQTTGPRCYEHDLPSCSKCMAYAHDSGQHPEFVVGCLPCAKQQLGVSS